MATIDPPESAGVPEWVVTFGDMMSLLLTFFIMLFAMSEIKHEQKLQDMIESMRRVFGYESAALSMAPGKHQPRNSSLDKLASLGRAKRANIVKGGVPIRAPVGDRPRVNAVRPDGHPAIAGVVFFKDESDELTEDDQQALRAIVARLAGMPQRIEIRGHTSNRPLPADAPWRDHWDLAYARCRNVEQAMVGAGMDPQRIRLGVAAGNELKYRGTDPLLQEENPRVEVLLLAETVKDQSPQSENEASPP